MKTAKQTLRSTESQRVKEQKTEWVGASQRWRGIDANNINICMMLFRSNEHTHKFIQIADGNWKRRRRHSSHFQEFRRFSINYAIFINRCSKHVHCILTSHKSFHTKQYTEIFMKWKMLKSIMDASVALLLVWQINWDFVKNVEKKTISNIMTFSILLRNIQSNGQIEHIWFEHWIFWYFSIIIWYFESKGHTRI